MLSVQTLFDFRITVGVLTHNLGAQLERVLNHRLPLDFYSRSPRNGIYFCIRMLFDLNFDFTLIHTTFWKTIKKLDKFPGFKTHKNRPSANFNFRK